MVNICESVILTELARSIEWFFCPPPFDRAGYIRAASEQVPNHNSRVLLGEETDRFGLRRVSLDWRLSPIDKETMRKCLLGLAVHFAKRDIGRIKIDPWLMNEDFDFPPKDKDELAGYHHMGTDAHGDFCNGSCGGRELQSIRHTKSIWLLDLACSERADTRTLRYL